MDLHINQSLIQDAARISVITASDYAETELLLRQTVEAFALQQDTVIQLMPSASSRRLLVLQGMPMVDPCPLADIVLRAGERTDASKQEFPVCASCRRAHPAIAASC